MWEIGERPNQKKTGGYEVSQREMFSIYHTDKQTGSALPDVCVLTGGDTQKFSQCLFKWKQNSCNIGPL